MVVLALLIALLGLGDGTKTSTHAPFARHSCSTGRSFLGVAPNRVQFVAHCSASAKGGMVQVSVGRYALGDVGAPAHIENFSHRLHVGSTYSQVSHGVCVRAGRGIGCKAFVHNRVRLSGYLRVKPESRCSRGIVMSAIDQVRCSSRVGCPLSAEVRTLFRQRPVGC